MRPTALDVAAFAGMTWLGYSYYGIVGAICGALTVLSFFLMIYYAVVLPQRKIEKAEEMLRDEVLDDEDL